VKIYYETYGNGPPVLVLHGGTVFLETMHYQITDLASDHFVVAPDTRGHGRSTDSPGPLHYADMTEDVIGLMDRLHIARADVVGWSDGGIVGLDLAMRHPDRIGRLVAIGANYDVAGLIEPATPISPESPSLAGARSFYRRVSPTPQNWPIFVAKVQRMWETEPHFSVADLNKIRAPVLVIAGEHDLIRRDHTDELAHAIPGAREVIVPGASHLVPLEDPKAIDSAIRAFLTSAHS
jgi:pimeloyl-ACP methyl ester carboxylesterase